MLITEDSDDIVAEVTESWDSPTLDLLNYVCICTFFWKLTIIRIKLKMSGNNIPGSLKFDLASCFVFVFLFVIVFANVFMTFIEIFEG